MDACSKAGSVLPEGFAALREALSAFPEEINVRAVQGSGRRPTWAVAARLARVTPEALIDPQRSALRASSSAMASRGWVAPCLDRKCDSAGAMC